MVTWVWRRVRSLTKRQLAAVAVTVIFPVLPPIVLSFFPVTFSDCWFVQVAYYGIYVGWIPVALLMMATMLKDDSARAEQRVEHRLEEFLVEVKRLDQQLEERRAQEEKALRDEINLTDQMMRDGFAQMGVDLPPRPVHLRARGELGGVLTGKATLSVSGPRGKWPRFRYWCRRAGRTMWRWFWG